MDVTTEQAEEQRNKNTLRTVLEECYLEVMACWDKNLDVSTFALANLIDHLAADMRALGFAVPGDE